MKSLCNVDFTLACSTRLGFFFSTSQEADILAGLLNCSQVSLSAGNPKVYGEGGIVRTLR